MKETQVQVEDESSDKPKSVLDRFKLKPKKKRLQPNLSVQLVQLCIKKVILYLYCCIVKFIVFYFNTQK